MSPDKHPWLIRGFLCQEAVGQPPEDLGLVRTKISVCTFYFGTQAEGTSATCSMIFSGPKAGVWVKSHNTAYLPPHQMGKCSIQLYSTGQCKPYVQPQSQRSKEAFPSTTHSGKRRVKRKFCYLLPCWSGLILWTGIDGPFPAGNFIK